MSKLNLVIGQKYKVKGFSKPVVLDKFNIQTKTAYVNDNGTIKAVWINEILEPVMDGAVRLFIKWIVSLFTKK